jgi:hypothetical protein
MPNLRRRPLLLLASVLFAAVPVSFGIIRAVRAGNDLRYLWMAAAAILAAIAVTRLWRGTAAPGDVSVGRALVAVIGATGSAAAAALILGATAGSGIAIVSFAFGVCIGVSAVLATLARTAPAP